MLRILRFWLIVAAILGNGNALAQNYPTGPVKIILSNSAGGSPDITARIRRGPAQQSARTAGLRRKQARRGIRDRCPSSSACAG